MLDLSITRLKEDVKKKEQRRLNLDRVDVGPKI